MATLAKLTSIGILVVSFLLAILLYYVMSSKKKSYKHQTIEFVLSIFINLIIYVWIAKIFLNIGTFFKDPLAVLAYPSNSQAFYLALIFLLVHILFQMRKDNRQFKQSREAIVPIFLSASFFYEFIHTVTRKSVFSPYYLALLFILLIPLLIGFDKERQQTFHLSLMIVWCMGTLILTIVLPYTTIFGYLISPIFIVVLLCMFIGLLIYKQRKVV